MYPAHSLVEAFVFYRRMWLTAAHAVGAPRHRTLAQATGLIFNGCRREVRCYACLFPHASSGHFSESPLD